MSTSDLAVSESRGGIQWPVEPEMKAVFDAASENRWIAPTEEFRTDNGPKAAPEQSREWAQAAHVEVVELIRHLYVDLGEDAGGPLHVILDDGNVDDHWLGNDLGYDRYAHLFDGGFERYADEGADTSMERKNAIRDTCEQILTLLRPMTEQQRRDAINEFWKDR